MWGRGGKISNYTLEGRTEGKVVCSLCRVAHVLYRAAIRYECALDTVSIKLTFERGKMCFKRCEGERECVRKKSETKLVW